MKKKPDIMAVLSCNDVVGLRIDGVRYDYIIDPPDVSVAIEFDRRFVRNKGQAVAYIKKRAARVIRHNMPPYAEVVRHRSDAKVFSLAGTTSIMINLPDELIVEFTDHLAKQGGNVNDFFRLRIKAFLRAQKSYDLEDKIQFGKYREEPLEVIIRNDPTYIVWCQSNVDGFRISPQAETLLSDTLVFTQEIIDQVV